MEEQKVIHDWLRPIQSQFRQVLNSYNLAVRFSSYTLILDRPTK